MKIRLSWIDLDTGTEGECIAGLPITIGRGPENTVVLDSGSVSRLHATLSEEFGNIVLADEQSRNGTFINAERVAQAMVGHGSRFQVGQFVFTIAVMWEAEEGPDPLEATQAQLVSEATLIFDERTDQLIPSKAAAAASTPMSITFPPAFFEEVVVSEAAVRESGLPVEEITYLAVGGGLGSFAWIDGLRISGVPASEIVSIGFEEQPHGRYERLARHSQIPDHERLRSNSDSCPDNLWGWPGYGVREIWSSLKKGDLKAVGRVAWQLFGEPVLVEPYTPRAGDVYRSLEREAIRIGWSTMWRYGRVRAIRKTDHGRYVVAYSQGNDQPAEQRHRLMIAPYLHVALGYPGVRFLPDLQKYRQQTHDFEKVVNAYEDHDHVYEHLLQHGGQVLIRGRGIVASRIVQRLTEVRERNHNIKIMHLMRSPNVEGSLYKRAQRTVANHWELQPYNFPKACFGGDLKVLLATVSDEERSQLLDLFGGTTTADRVDWQQMIQDGLAEGWYDIRFGRVLNVERQGDMIVTNLQLSEENEQLAADFIIDATGLEASVEANPLLKDLIDTYELPFNIKGRLQVGDDYELLQLRNGHGRVYAAGAMTFGNHFAPVDSFVGLQYTALLSLDTLCQLNAPYLQRLNGWRSFSAWLRWARGVSA